MPFDFALILQLIPKSTKHTFCSEISHTGLSPKPIKCFTPGTVLWYSWNLSRMCGNCTVITWAHISQHEQVQRNHHTQREVLADRSDGGWHSSCAKLSSVLKKVQIRDQGQERATMCLSMSCYKVLLEEETLEQ